MTKPRWYKNQAGSMSTIVRPSIAVSPEEMRFIAKKAKEFNGSAADYLYHLTKGAIDLAMQQEGEWSE